MESLRDKVDKLCDATRRFGELHARAQKLRQRVRVALAMCRIAGAGVPNPQSAASSALGLFPAVTQLERDLAAAVQKMQAAAGVPRRVREEVALCQRIEKSAALPLAIFMSPDEWRSVNETDGTCDECGSACNPSANLGRFVCTVCGADKQLPPSLDLATNFVTNEDAEVARSAARSAENSYNKNALTFLRQLQGNEACAFSEEQAQALLACARRERISGRNFCVEWARDVLQELRLTKYNDQISTLARLYFRVEVPQLTDEVEQSIAARVENDIVCYLEMKQEEEPTGRRRNALPCAYLVYRHIDAIFAPGEPQRKLLRLIHLPERATLENYETAYWEICRRQKREYFSLGPPPLEPFNVHV